MNSKSYLDQEKYRCVLSYLFDPIAKYDEEAAGLVASGLDSDEVEALIGDRPLPIGNSILIDNSVNYVFDTSRAGRYVANRFNDEHLAALYTGRSEDTALAERKHHWNAAQRAAYTIFSVKFSGTVRDIRDEVANGSLAFPEDYAPCQSYARDAVVAGLDGLVAPSKRLSGSSCCVLFARKTISPGRRIKDSTF